jgi:hypothetical protein
LTLQLSPKDSIHRRLRVYDAKDQPTHRIGGGIMGDKSPKNTSKTKKQQQQKKTAKGSKAPAKK